jgi:hypothetical protein
VASTETLPELQTARSVFLVSRRSCWLFGAVTAVVVTAIYSIRAGRSLDYDGSVTVGAFVRHGSLLGVFRSVYNFNNHPYFSFVEHLVWSLGGRSEVWLRVVPIACAAATVGLLTSWTASRRGLLAGAIAGSVLAANPMFADLSRSVRGYSLMTLGCLVATLLLADSVKQSWSMTRAQSVVYVVALGVAIGTQSYAALVLAAHLATVLARRRFDADWRRRVECVVAIGLLPYAAMVRQLLVVARSRPGTLQPRFPADAARALLGQQLVAVALLAALLIISLRASSARSVAWPATICLTLALLVIWLLLHPLDFYPRFLVWLVPVVAFGAATAVARHPKLACVALLAVAAMVSSQVSTWTRDPIASRQVARIVDETRARHQIPCAAGYSSEVIFGYTSKARAVFTPEQLHGCDLLFADDDTSQTEIHALGCYFTHERALGGETPMSVFSGRRSHSDTTGCNR